MFEIGFPPLNGLWSIKSSQSIWRLIKNPSLKCQKNLMNQEEKGIYSGSIASPQRQCKRRAVKQNDRLLVIRINFVEGLLSKLMSKQIVFYWQYIVWIVWFQSSCRAENQIEHGTESMANWRRPKPKHQPVYIKISLVSSKSILKYTIYMRLLRKELKY